MSSVNQRDYAVCWWLMNVLAVFCCANANYIVDQLTGFLWDEQEADQIKSTKLEPHQ